jgi:hypothetical protein
MSVGVINRNIICASIILWTSLIIYFMQIRIGFLNDSRDVWMFFWRAKSYFRLQYIMHILLTVSYTQSHKDCIRILYTFSLEILICMNAINAVNRVRYFFLFVVVRILLQNNYYITSVDSNPKFRRN